MKATIVFALASMLTAETMTAPPGGATGHLLPAIRVYTGCVRAGLIPGTFVLSEGRLTTVGGGNDRSDSRPTTFTLVGPSFHLSDHLGRRVAVTGALVPPVRGSTGNEERPILSVRSVKTMSPTCQRTLASPDAWARPSMQGR